MESPKNHLQIIVFLMILVLVLILVGVTATRPTTETRATTSDAVAILVVDAFEKLPDTRVVVADELSNSGGNCTVTPDGQGGWVSGVGGWVSGVGGWVSGVGGWVSGVGGWVSGVSPQPILDPHGRIVYNEFEALIRQSGGLLHEFHIGSQLADTIATDTGWLRDVGRWNLGDDGDVWLVGVDTDEFTTEVIGERIETAIELMDRQFGVSRFVVNMSFAIIPCEDILTQQDYEDTLSEPQFDSFRDDLIDALTAFADMANGIPMPDSAVKFLASPEAEQFRQALLAHTREQFDTCYPFIPANPDLPGQTGDAVAQGQLRQDTIPNLQGLPETTICADVQPENDPLGQVMTRLRSLELQNGPISIIPVAASGNRGDAFSFAPGFWPEIVSVSAFYNDPELCSGFPIPPSNAGEVQMYGMYDCLPGTSFAAPRLSLEAAVYLLRGGSTTCSGAAAESSPPLAYLSGVDSSGNPTFEYLFLNAGRVVASDAVCTDFNGLVGVPPTPTP